MLKLSDDKFKASRFLSFNKHQVFRQRQVCNVSTNLNQSTKFKNQSVMTDKGINGLIELEDFYRARSQAARD